MSFGVLSFGDWKICRKREYCGLIFLMLRNELLFDQVEGLAELQKTCSCNEIYECPKGSLAPRIEMIRKPKHPKTLGVLRIFSFIVQVQTLPYPS